MVFRGVAQPPGWKISFTVLCGPSWAQLYGQKIVPWNHWKHAFKDIYLSFICQNFSSNGPTGKKFDVLPSTAFKRTALQPLKAVKTFFDTFLVLEEVWWVSFD